MYDSLHFKHKSKPKQHFLHLFFYYRNLKSDYLKGEILAWGFHYHLLHVRRSIASKLIGKCKWGGEVSAVANAVLEALYKYVILVRYISTSSTPLQFNLDTFSSHVTTDLCSCAPEACTALFLHTPLMHLWP